MTVRRPIPKGARDLVSLGLQVAAVAVEVELGEET
jgi:hypothetical protein